uniref:Uncharacterized protein n=1 Tax=Leersia perrieri TaxID=77586 RepID=A0A0D9V5T3_9ORYZ
MDSNSIEEERRPQQQEVVLDAPEMDDELLVKLLDASLVTEEADDVEDAERRKHQQQQQQQKQLGFVTADVGDGGWEMMSSIHPHQEEGGCEDCGLDDILSDFDGCGGYAYVDVDDDPVEFWMEGITDHAIAGLGLFGVECTEEWYMDGMAMEWEDGRSYYSFHYPSYGADAACADQLYSSPLWE